MLFNALKSMFTTDPALVVKNLDTQEVYKLYKENRNDYIFIDIREPFEWKTGVIPSISKISMGNLQKDFPKMDKKANYIIVCRTGSRSSRISKTMKSLGFENVYNYKGGMMSWKLNNLPTE